MKEAKAGTKLWSDRDYSLAALPDEVKGGTLILRTTADGDAWLAPGVVRALKGGTAYVLVRWKVLGKENLDEVAFAKLEREGWAEVKGAVETTFPTGEDWQWKALKKNVKKGDVILQLKTLSWRCSAVFVFK